WVWKLKIAVQEFPVIALVPIAILSLAPPYFSGDWPIARWILAGTAFIIWSYPLFYSSALVYQTKKQIAWTNPLEPTPWIGQLSMEALRSVEPDSILSIPLSDGQTIAVDLYFSEQEKKAPVVFVVHGGGWDAGNSREMASFNRVLTSWGFHVASINYRLAPVHPYPTAVNDVVSAVKHLLDRKTGIQATVGGHFLLGRSAGGQIALQAASALGNQVLSGVIAFYAPADLIWGHQRARTDDLLNSKKLMEQYLGAPNYQPNGLYFQASPVHTAGSNFPRTLLIHGLQDNMVSPYHSRSLMKRLQKCGVSCTLLELPWATHGADFNYLGPSGRITTALIKRFISTKSQMGVKSLSVVERP
ncbi:MAG TPA: alpha/beta hydrolase, partial [Luteibaculaceae bacterium]|nr:alpha/beta hydrolase [Luteibaculaceae bacterium]